MRKFAKINWSGLLKNQGGFSLTEALISVVLLSTGLLAYGTLSGSVIDRNTHSERESVATTLAQDKIEELRNMVVEGTPLGNAVGLTNPRWVISNWGSSFGETLNPEGGTDGVLQYTRTWTITKPTPAEIGSNGGDGGTGSFGIYNLQVKVAWNSNGPHEVELNTRISE